MASVRAAPAMLSFAAGCMLAVELPETGGGPPPADEMPAEPCVQASDCAVVEDCTVPACVNGECSRVHAAEGAPCDDGRRVCNEDGTCGLRVNGVECEADADCSSAHCVDTVCCQSPCTNRCMGCAVPGLEGECAPVPLGDDAVEECSGTLRCNGHGDCGAEYLGSALFGGDGDDFGIGVAVSPAGELALTGRIDGSVLFGDDTVGATEPNNYYVARLDAALSPRWAGGDGLAAQPGFQNGTAACHDPDGNLYVVGSFTDSIKLGPTSFDATDAHDVFVARYDATGGVDWAVSFGSVGDDIGVSIAHDDVAGRVVVVGTYDDTLPIGPSYALSTTGGVDVFVAALRDADGLVNGADTLGSIGNDTVAQIVWHSALGLVVVGTTADDLHAGGAVIGAGTQSPAVVHLKSNLSVLTAYVPSTAGSAEGLGLAVDSTGAVVLVGSLKGSLTLDSDVITSAGIASELFYAKVRLVDETFEHGRILGPVAIAGAPLRVVVDDSDAIVIAGSFTDTMDLGGGELTSLAGEDLFVLKLDSAGGYGWSQRYGGLGMDRIHALAISPGDASIALAGGVTADIDFGGGPLQPAGANTSDIFAAKLGP